jgi:hypothetical protein
MPRRPSWQVKRKDVTVIGSLSKIDQASIMKKRHAGMMASKSKTLTREEFVSLLSSATRPLSPISPQ